MKIIFLGPYCKEIFEHLSRFGDKVIRVEDKLSLKSAVLKDADFLISYRYRYLLEPDVVDKFTNKAINLHISFLPWNRGADPNLWSFLEDTPKGVTIHYMDRGIDTGDIVAQKKVGFSKGDTFRSTYERLTKELVCLFKDAWADIRNGKITPLIQSGNGSFHQSKDKEKYLHLLRKKWDTPVSDIIGIFKHREKRGIITIKKCKGEQDINFLRVVRNSVLNVSIEKSKITPKQHLSWYLSTKKLGIIIYIIWFDKKRVGYIRINTHYFNDISIALLKEYQDQGIGSQALSQLPEGKYKAIVNVDNRASLSFFRRNGFRFVGFHAIFEKTLDKN